MGPRLERRCTGCPVELSLHIFTRNKPPHNTHKHQQQVGHLEGWMKLQQWHLQRRQQKQKQLRRLLLL